MNPLWFCLQGTRVQFLVQVLKESSPLCQEQTVDVSPCLDTFLIPCSLLSSSSLVIGLRSLSTSRICLQPQYPVISAIHTVVAFLLFASSMLLHCRLCPCSLTLDFRI